MIKIKNIIASIVALSTMVFTSSVLAANETLGKRIDVGNESIASFGNMMMLVVGVGGVLILFLGAWGLKQYADDSRSNPLMKPMLYFIAGAILTGFTAWKAILSQTVTGSDASNDTGTFKAK